MFVTEALVSPTSQYYIYSPTQEGQKSLLYPLCLGSFSYLPGYSLHRSSYDSFLIMYVKKGACTLHTPSGNRVLDAGQSVLINCYKPHGYSSNCGWDADWLHFDGAGALEYYNYLCTIGSSDAPVVNAAPVGMDKLLAGFNSGNVINEAAMSMLINGMLSTFTVDNCHADIAEAHEPDNAVSVVTSYINSNFSKELSVEQLADMAHLSKYYFIRLFKSHTGYTPHEYLVKVRLSHAQYLLKNTALTIKEICFASGFTGESRFCTCFRDSVGMTPSEYRGVT